MKTKFRKGQKVICTHYKNRPILRVDSVDGDKIWVSDKYSATLGTWWGPKEWFKAIRPVKRPRPHKPVTKHSGFLCEDNVQGCSCNQWASVSQ